MAEQLQLVDVAAPAPKLTANQRLAYDYVAGRDGVSVDEIGAFIHAHRPRKPHGVDERCDWCAKTGQQLVTSKALAPLVTYRRAPGGRLYLLRTADRTAEPADRSAASGQLDVLPGSEFEHIFGMPAPTDDADQAPTRSNTAEEPS